MSQPYPGNPGDPGRGYPPPGYLPSGYPPPAYPPPGYPPPGYTPGGYPPPGYPPPPGYASPGYASGGYPPAGYPPAPGFAGPPAPQFDIGDALSWSWNNFSRNAAALVVSLLGYAVLLAVVSGVWALAFFGALGTPAQFVVVVVGYIAALVASMFVQAAYLSGCLDIADGRPVTIGSFFQPRNFGPAMITALLAGLLTAIGTMLCIVPGLIVAFLAQFATAFVIDRSLSPINSFKASFATCRGTIGDALLSWLVQLTVLLVGEMLCGVGLLVAFPLAVLIQTYTYRRLSGGWVAPVQV